MIVVTIGEVAKPRPAAAADVLPQTPAGEDSPESITSAEPEPDERDGDDRAAPRDFFEPPEHKALFSGRRERVADGDGAVRCDGRVDPEIHV